MSGRKYKILQCCVLLSGSISYQNENIYKMSTELSYEKDFPAGDDSYSYFENPLRLSWRSPWVLFHPTSSKEIPFPTELETWPGAHLGTWALSCPSVVASLVANTEEVICSIQLGSAGGATCCWWHLCWLFLNEPTLWFSGSQGDNFKQVSEFLQHLKCKIHFFLCRQNTSVLNKMTAALPRMYMSRCIFIYSHH